MIVNRAAFRGWPGKILSTNSIDKMPHGTPFPIGASTFSFTNKGSMMQIVPLDESNGMVTIYDPDVLAVNKSPAGFLDGIEGEFPYSARSHYIFRPSTTYGYEILGSGGLYNVPSLNGEMTVGGTAVRIIKDRVQAKMVRYGNDAIYYSNSLFPSALSHVCEISNFVSFADDDGSIFITGAHLVPVIRMMEYLGRYTRYGEATPVTMNNLQGILMKASADEQARSRHLFSRDDDGRPYIYHWALYERIARTMLESVDPIAKGIAYQITHVSALTDYTSIPNDRYRGAPRPIGRTTFWSQRIVPYDQDTEVSFSSPFLYIRRMMDALRNSNGDNVVSRYANCASTVPNTVNGMSLLSSGDVSAVISSGNIRSLAAGELIAEALRRLVINRFMWFQSVTDAVVDVYPMTDPDHNRVTTTLVLGGAVRMLSQRIIELARTMGIELQTETLVAAANGERVRLQDVVSCESELINGIMRRIGGNFIEPRTLLQMTPHEDPVRAILAAADDMIAVGIAPSSMLSTPATIAAMAPDRTLRSILAAVHQGW